jgi:hypothetical protein
MKSDYEEKKSNRVRLVFGSTQYAFELGQDLKGARKQ